jgi:NADPH-dependent 2,4-dienoyl-CoA reductase/sulfur reductase-like enzyme
VGTLIVGTSVAAVRTAQALRMMGYADTITLLGEEPHLPYDKPPLSKEMLDKGGAPVPLLTEAEAADLSLELRLGMRAAGLDSTRRQVRAEDGEVLDYGDLVIATGVTPRVLPGASALPGVHTLRTHDDAVAVRTAMGVARRLVVIGAGFIGSEVAAAARRRGLSVEIVEPQQIPMAHLFGPEVAVELAQLHELNGVVVHAGVGVAALVGDAHVKGVLLTDGRTLDADLVVVGIGAVPATDWLVGSGLPLEDGVLCDEQLRVVGVEHVFAAGDVARWPSSFAESPVRIEHWTNANEHGALVAASIMGLEAPRAQPPYVWSDQYGHRIQIAGIPRAGQPAVVAGSVAEGTLVALFADGERRTIGAVVLDDARAFMRCRRAVGARTPVDQVDLGLVTDSTTRRND